MCVTQMSQKFNGQMLLALIETEPPALCYAMLPPPPPPRDYHLDPRTAAAEHKISLLFWISS